MKLLRIAILWLVVFSYVSATGDAAQDLTAFGSATQRRLQATLSTNPD